jgi:hypothetical protein
MTQLTGLFGVSIYGQLQLGQDDLGNVATLVKLC